MIEADDTPEVLNGGDRLERSRDDLACSSTLPIFGQASFEQLGVCQDHAELVVEPVEDLRQFHRRINRHGRLTRRLFRRHG